MKLRSFLLQATSYKLQASSGFTLIEIVVSVVIVSTLAAIIAVAFPSARDQQRLGLTQQEIQLRLREARQRALNEDRPSECLLRYADDDLKHRRRCSDIGVYVAGQELTLYADTSGDGSYSAAGDYVLSAATLPASVVSSGVQSFQFIAAPPTIGLFVDGREVTDASEPLRLRTGSTESTFVVTAAGELQRQ